jgi:hypothetical protein
LLRAPQAVMDFKYVVRIAAVAVLCLSCAETAAGSEFTINACQADRAEFSTRAFENFAHRGMMWKRACDPEGPGLRGLVTANVVRAGRVEQGSRSYFVLRAPDGTRFSRFVWSGQVRRRDCRYSLQLWAARPDGSTVRIRNVRANRGCPGSGRYQAAGWPRPRSYDVAGATLIVQRVLCVGSAKTPYCSARSLNYIRTFKAAATVVDTSPPGVVIARDTPLTQGRWVRGTQQVNYAALDNVGVRVARAIAGGSGREEQPRPCNFALRIPCPNGPGSIGVDTRALRDGVQPMVVRAEDAAGNWSHSAPVTVRIDNTAPGAIPLAVAGGQGWRNLNSFEVSWANSEGATQAPITAAHYRLCGPAGSGCVTGRVGAADISLLSNLSMPSAGSWTLCVWREDAAGNHQPSNASVPVTLQYDPEPPIVAFEQPSQADPTLMAASVSDRVSGLAGGQIEISRQGSGTWHQISTVRDGSRLLARIDDARFPAGNYVLRATAYDHATNHSMSDRKLNGEQMVIALPVRSPTVIRAGIKRRVRRHGKGRRGSRSTLVRRAHVGLGREVKLAGQVRFHGAAPIPGAEVQILARTSTSPERVVAALRADESGRYTFVTHAQSTTVLRALYAGSRTTLPSQAEASVLVPAASTISARPRRVLNGRTVTFGGRVRSRPTPASGKLIEMQVVLSGRWQTFKTVRSRPDGHWVARYRFRRSCGLLRYRFRARLPEEAGYAFETGYTRALDVQVRGARCL